MSARLRRYWPEGLLALGAALATASYGFDPTYEDSGYPLNSLSTAGVIAGWILVLAGLSGLAPSMVSRWMAVIASLSFLAGPSNAGTAEMVLFAVGFAITAVLILLAVGSIVVSRCGWKGRVIWAIVLAGTGLTAASNLGYPDQPFLDSPARQILGCLIASPIVIGVGSLWTRLDRKSVVGITATPASLARRFVAGMLSWVSWGVLGAAFSEIASILPTIVRNAPAEQAIAGVLNSSWLYLADVVLLQIVPTALWGRTFGQLIAGVRVVRIDNGSVPGLLRSFARFVVFQTVPIVGFIYLMALGMNARYNIGSGVPTRLAWDLASGTEVVIARSARVSKHDTPVTQFEKPAGRDATWQSYE